MLCSIFWRKACQTFLFFVLGLILLTTKCEQEVKDGGKIESPLCYICNTIKLFLLKASDEAGNLMSGALEKVCLILYNSALCNDFKHSLKLLVFNILEAIFNKTFCSSSLHLCKYPEIIMDNDFDFIKKTLKNIPPQLYFRKPKNSSKSFRIGIISDIHLDPVYKEGSSSTCYYSICCRDEFSHPIKNETRAGKFGNLGHRCSIPPITLESAIQSLNEKKLDLVLWLGDTYPQDDFNSNYENVLEVITIATNIIKTNLEKSTLVLPILGNHDTSPINQINGISIRENEFFLNISQIWEGWLGMESMQSFSKYGFYSHFIPEHNLRIIAYQSQVEHVMNSFLYSNPTNFLGTLDWINSLLYSSEKKKEDVIIIGHIAPNIKAVDYHWTLRFNSIIERYSNIIKALFFGHYHMEYFYPFKSLFDNQTFQIGFANPSITTFTSGNPAYRVVNFDSVSNSLINHFTYRLYLDEANKEGIAKWNLAYNFLDEYNITEISPNAIDKIISDMWSDYKVYLRMLFIYFNEYYSDDMKKYTSNSSIEIRCLFSSSDPHSFWDCEDRYQNPPLINFLLRNIQEIIFRNWFSISPKHINNIISKPNYLVY